MALIQHHIDRIYDRFFYALTEIRIQLFNRKYLIPCSDLSKYFELLGKDNGILKYNHG